jgi:UDP-2,4-diacetamido-2,4,6-trideoxy-beta-L-altropyranose hydrolase
MSTRPTCVFRADASAALGGGHVMRCLTLAAALTDAGWDCAFAVDAETRATVRALDAVPCVILAAAESPASLRTAFPRGVDLLVTDSYAIGHPYESACRGWARLILAIDDLADRPHDCNLLVDQTLARGAEAYVRLVPANARLLLGSRFALLRPEFARLRDGCLSERSRRPARRILVSAGLTDLAGVTVVLVEGARRAAPDHAIDVAIGSSCPHVAAIAAACSAAQATLHVDSDDIPGLMAQADLALGAPGATAWERCCLGLPAALVVLADNQRDNAAALEAAGAARILGRHGPLSAAAVAAGIEAILAKPDTLYEMSRRAAATCDGLGTSRVLEALGAVA